MQDPSRLKHVEEIKTALHTREGCRVYGHIKVQRVAGNFHISVHSQNYQTLQMVFHDVSKINVSHSIKRLSFGEDYPGKVDPLQGFVRVIQDQEESGTYKYFLKVVPTTYTKKHGVLDYLSGGGSGGGGWGVGGVMGAGGEKPNRGVETGARAGVGGGVFGLFRTGAPLKTNLYSVTEYFSASKGWDSTLPAVYFLYDLSPITVEISDAPGSLGHFLTRVCAVVGGVSQGGFLC